KKSGSSNIKLAEGEINEIKSGIKSDLKGYILNSKSESIPFSLLEKKFHLSEDLLINIFKDLFESNDLTGQINLIKKRYTKKRFGTDEPIVGESAVESKAYDLPKLNRSEIVRKQRELENQLLSMEDVFETINFPFKNYIEYQNNIAELNFIEQKLKIFSENLDSNKCIICFKQFNKKDKISECGNNHYFHHKCIKLWLENQKLCPICDVNILDNLKVIFLDTIEKKDDLISLHDVIDKLKSKINNLENQLKKREEQIYLMKEYSEKDKSIFEKLMIERDNKHLLKKELKKKDHLIDELRSLLEIIKK
ncbi:MAG: RING finger domain-containing protein, partial [Promethearchaeota archaeon]